MRSESARTFEGASTLFWILGFGLFAWGAFNHVLFLKRGDPGYQDVCQAFRAFAYPRDPLLRAVTGYLAGAAILALACARLFWPEFLEL